MNEKFLGYLDRSIEHMLEQLQSVRNEPARVALTIKIQEYCQIRYMYIQLHDNKEEK